MSTKPKLKIVPAATSAEHDPVRLAQGEVNRAAAATKAALDHLTTERQLSLVARKAFDDGMAGVDVDRLAHRRELLESAERKHGERVKEEQKARAELAQAEADRAATELAEREAWSQSWRGRIAASFERARALDAARAELADTIADIVEDARQAHTDACALETIVKPSLNMASRGIVPPELADAKHLLGVFIGRVRAREDRDGYSDGWLDAVGQPDWKDPKRDRWTVDNAFLDSIEKETK